MTTAPAPTTIWHHDLYVNGEIYPTRHHVDLDRGTYTTHLDLPVEGIQYMRAIHEAGHAIAALTTGGHLHFAEIQTPDSTAPHGGTTYACGLDDGTAFAAFCGAGERANDRWLRQEGLWTERRAVTVEAAATGDRALLLSVNPHIGFGDKEGDYQHVHNIADRLIDQHWNAILAVGEALVRRTRLEGDDIADLVGIPNGPHRSRI